MKNLGIGSKKLTFNAPIILGFTLLCFVALVLEQITGVTNQMFFSVYRSSLLNPLTYVRMLGHVCGHAGWSHFSGNIMLLLLIGPILEEKYGSSNILLVMVVTAIVTAVINLIFFPTTMLLGASGIVFAFIILSSFTGVKEGEIPVTFLLISIIYIGGQVYDGIFVKDNVSNLTHIVGGIIGGMFGYIMNNKVTKLR
ncbi:MAG: rhomboid family intramembrane serine protease [bacterium]|nr:rhomboid family intramembrane serine protease [bacterium]